MKIEGMKKKYKLVAEVEYLTTAQLRNLLLMVHLSDDERKFVIEELLSRLSDLEIACMEAAGAR